MAKILGFADVVVNGVTLLSGQDATLDTGGVKRTPVIGNKVHGYREEVVPATVEVSVSIDASYSADTLNNVTDATVNFVADTGQTWMVAHAWNSDPAKITAKDGTAKHTFTGQPAEEIV